MPARSIHRTSSRAVCLPFAVVFASASMSAWADFEEVRIVRADPINYQACPPTAPMAQPYPQPTYTGQQAPPPQGPQPVIGGFTGREIAGGVAGAAVGGVLGNQVGSGSGRTAATVAGAAIGAYAGYKLAEEKPQASPPPAAAYPPPYAPAPAPTAQPYPQPTYTAQQAPPPQGPQPVLGGLTGREIAGGVAGAAVGGVLGNQVGSGSGRTAATVAGTAIGAYAGYKLAEEKPQANPPPPAAGYPPPAYAQPVCTLVTHYRVHYVRPNGMTGDVMMTSAPIGTALMINFCGDRPCQ